MELQDDIAGRLVNIGNFVETKTLDEKDPERCRTLKAIGEMAKEAYTSARSKSHEWYFNGSEEERTAFSQRVFRIVDWGFDVTPKSKGFGLVTLKNRIGEMKGSLKITSSAQGMELLVVIPFSAEAGE